MPHVQITWVEGRTAEQKRKIAERVTNILIEDGRAKREFTESNAAYVSLVDELDTTGQQAYGFAQK